MDFGGAILPPEFALFFDVYRGFQDFPPPDIGIRIIHHDAQYLVLLRVFKPFPGFPPPDIDIRIIRHVAQNLV